MLTTLMNGRAFAEKFGSGPADVVALHGWGRSRHDWTTTLEGYDALALDLPGFGATPAPPEAWTPAEYAVWVADILRELDRPVLMGHSFGGRIAVRLAAASPELVSGVVLTGVPLLRTQMTARPKRAFRLMRTLNRRGLISDERMEALRHKHGSDDYRNAEGVMRDVLVKAVNEDYAADLSTIGLEGVPVAMVWGEHDTAAPVAMAREAHRLLGERATLEIVEGSAHLLDPALDSGLRHAVESLRGDT